MKPVKNVKGSAAQLSLSQRWDGMIGVFWKLVDYALLMGYFLLNRYAPFFVMGVAIGMILVLLRAGSFV